MSFAKQTSFDDRLKAAAEAKKAQLAKFKPKEARPDPNFHERESIRQAELDAVRQRRLAEKEAARAAAEAEKQARVEALVMDEQAQLEAKRAERKARKAAAKEEARLRREIKKIGR